MTSATQSNSGASAYSPCWRPGSASLISSSPAISTNQKCSPTVRGLFAASSAHLGRADARRSLPRKGERTGARYEAMWNYEAVIKETKPTSLIADKKEPLYAIIPRTGVSVGDSPLGFVDRGVARRSESFFADLQAFLLKAIPGADRRDRASCRLGRAAPIKADPTTNLDPSRALTVVRHRSPRSFQKALSLYR